MIPNCTNGHDLTQPDAYAYTNTGLRSCRACQQQAKAQKRKGQGFTGSWLNQNSESPRDPVQ